MAAVSWSLGISKIADLTRAGRIQNISYVSSEFHPATFLKPLQLKSVVSAADMAENQGFSRGTHVKCSALMADAPDNDRSLGKSPVLSVDWLHRHLHEPNLKVVDASWYMPAEQRNPLQEFHSCHIPGALFFDIDAIVDDSTDLPHMLPSETAFTAAMSALGLENPDTVVVYDGKGIFSAARAWWMFRVFGHEKVYVLNGGLPQWRASAYPIETATSEETLSKIHAASEAVQKANQGLQVDTGTFKATFQPNLVWSLAQVKKNVEEKVFQHIDARSKPRFDGVAPEPRKGIPSGHVPGSKCVPFTEVLDNRGLLLPSDVLKTKFQDAGLSLEAPMVTSCGTGVTACILTLALHQLGIENVPVYDGSWTEWGGRADTPVAPTYLVAPHRLTALGEINLWELK